MSGEHGTGTSRRYRVYQVGGIVFGVLFLGLGVAAFLVGAGPVIAGIAGIGGLVVLIVSIVMMARS